MENARIFIDAYNLICNDPVLSGQPSVEQSRESLRMLCRRYLSRHPGHIIYLVFDGDSSVGAVPEKTSGQILNEKREIYEVFTVTGMTADQWIIRMIRQMVKSDEMVIVTRDTELKESGSSFGAMSIEPDIFVRESKKASAIRKKRAIVPYDRGSDRYHQKHTSREAGKQISPNTEKDIRDEFERAFGDRMDEPLSF